MKKNFPKTEAPYVKVPNTFIRYSDQDEIAATDIQFKLFLYIYFSTSLGIFETCSFSIEQLLRMSGMRTERKHLKRISRYSDLLKTLDWFVENEYIAKSEKPFCSYLPQETITIHYTGEDLPIDGYLSNGKYKISERFTKITRYEFYALTAFNTSANALLDLFAFAYIKSLIIHRRKDKFAIQEKPECCYLSYDTLAIACDVSRNTIVKSVQHLNDMGLIVCQKPDNIEKFENKVKYNVSTSKFSNLKMVYVLNIPGYEKELECGIQKYMNDNKVCFKYLD